MSGTCVACGQTKPCPLCQTPDGVLCSRHLVEQVHARGLLLFSQQNVAKELIEHLTNPLRDEIIFAKLMPFGCFSLLTKREICVITFAATTYLLVPE